MLVHKYVQFQFLFHIQFVKVPNSILDEVHLPSASTSSTFGATYHVIKAWMYDVKGASEQHVNLILAFMNGN